MGCGGVRAAWRFVPRPLVVMVAALRGVVAVDLQPERMIATQGTLPSTVEATVSGLSTEIPAPSDNIDRIETHAYSTQAFSERCPPMASTILRVSAERLEAGTFGFACGLIKAWILRDLDRPSVCGPLSRVLVPRMNSAC